MKKKLFWSIYLALCLILSLSAQVLADTYTHYITFTVSDNSSTARTNLPILTGISAQSLINAGYLDSSGNQTSLQESSTDKNYGVATGNVSLFIESLAALQTRTYKFFTGYSPADSHKIIPGYGGYITTNDTAALELSNNGTVEYSGYVDTTAGMGNIINKSGAIRTAPSATVSGNITLGVVSTVIDYLIPNAVGDIDDNTATPVVDNYLNVDDPVGASDNDTTYNSINSPVQTMDLLNVSAPSTLDPEYISSISVEVYYNVKSGNGADTAFAQPVLRLGGSTEYGTEVSTTSSTYQLHNETISRPGGGSWIYSDLASLQVGYRLRHSAVTSSRTSFVYAKVTYMYYLTRVSVAGISSGDLTVIGHLDGTNMWMTVDNIASTNISVTSIPDNGNSYVFGSNATPYMNYIKLSVSGTEKLQYNQSEQSLISGSNLIDRDNTANGTITWGTNPSNIIISIGGITSYTSTISSSSSSTTAHTVDTLSQPTNWFASGAFTGVLTPELKQVITDAATNIGMQERSLYVLLMLGVATAVGLSVLLFTGSSMIMIATVGVILMAGINNHILDGWFMAVYLMMAVPISYLSRQA